MYYDGDAAPFAGAVYGEHGLHVKGNAASVSGVRQAIAQALRTTLAPAATRKPAGADLPPVSVRLSASAENAVKQAQKLHKTPHSGGQISILVIGETHQSARAPAGPDQYRADSLLHAIHRGSLAPSLVIMERALRYDQTGILPRPVGEATICRMDDGRNFNEQLSIKGRSALVAGFIFWVLANGDQHSNDFVIAFFGEEHGDILDNFEWLVQNVELTGVPWMRKRPRAYSLMRSLT